MATAAEYKERSQRWLDDIWNQRRPEVIHEMLGPDSIGHLEERDMLGPDPFAEFHARFVASFPDIRMTIEDSVAEGEQVVLRWIAEGTHRGPLNGIEPSGRTFRLRGMSWLRYENGRLVEGWDSWSMGSLLRQIAPPPAGAQDGGAATA